MKLKLALFLAFFLCICSMSWSQSIGGGGNSCVGSSASYYLQASSCSSYYWYVSGGTQNIDYQIMSSTNTAQQFVVKWLKARIGLRINCNYSCGTGSGTASTSEFSTYTVPNAIAADQAICSGQSTSIPISTNNGATGTTYSWTVTQSNVTGATSGNGSTISQYLTATTNTSGTATYRVTPVANSCQGPAIFVTATVKPVPTVSVSPSESQSICSGIAVTLTATNPNSISGTAFEWTAQQNNVIGASNTTGNSITQNLTATKNYAGNVLYTITASANGCSSYTSRFVTVKPIPTFTVLDETTICSGQTTWINISQPNGVSGTTYSWTSTSSNVSGASSGTGVPIQQKLDATTSANGTASYTITATADGCSSSKTSNAIVKPVPVASISPASQEICSGQQTGFSISNANGVAGTAFSWTVSQSNVTGASGNSGNSIAQTLSTTSNVIGTATYTVTASANGCSSSTSAVATVKRVPTASASNQTICSGTACSISITNPNNVSGTTFSWTPTQSNATGASTGSGPLIQQTLSATGSSTGTASYLITASANGCSSTTSSVVSVTPAPTASAANQAVFSGQTTSIAITNNNAIPGTAYSWTFSAVNASGAAPGSGASIAQTLTLTGLATGTVSYTITPVAGGCGGPAITSMVTVFPLPIIVSNNPKLTMGEVRLSLNTPYDTYEWRNAAGVLVGTGSFYNASSTGSYTVRVSKGGAVVTSTPFQVVGQFDGVDGNFIVAHNVLVKGIMSSTSMNTHSRDEVSQTVQYFDGLGRPIQTIETQASPSKRDMVQPQSYDNFGREVRKHLPFVAENNGYYKSGVIDQATGNYIGSAQNFYNNTSDNIADDSRPFGELVFESSPLNRPIKEYGPGFAWSALSGAENKFVQYQYVHHVYPTEKIIAWTLNSAGLPVRESPLAGYIETGGYYSSYQLSIKSIKDEKGYETREYVNQEGRVILKKVQAVATLPDINNKDHWAQTYYVYDNLGNLRYVFQPELTKIIVQSDTYNPSAFDLKNLAFSYRYDHRKRMIQKQLPGAEPVYLVYDDRNRQVFSQDGNQRTDKKWTFTKYDGLDRVIITGIYTHSAVIDQTAMAGLLNTTNLSERYNGDAGNHGYTNNVFTAPNFVTANFEVLAVNYYDSYGFKTLLNNAEFNYKNNELLAASGGIKAQDVAEFAYVKGLLTGHKSKVLNSTTWLWAASYYDDRYRIIQVTETNYRTGFNRTTNVYDFVGKLLRTKTFYSIPGQQDRKIIKRFSYDHAGRLKKSWHQVEGSPEVLLSEQEYNEIGQLIAKKLHQTSASGSPIAANPQVGQPGVTYDQNISSESYSSSQHTYIASNSIRLLPGFHVAQGNTFKAIIGYSEDDALAHNNSIAGTFLQVVDYRYNIRGWLTRINNADVSTPADGNSNHDFFGMELSYNTDVSGISTEKAYNGNVSAMKWSKGAGGTAAMQAYAFKYDPLNRLKFADHFDYKNSTATWLSNGNSYGESMTYDLNGNIQSLLRKGFMGANHDNLSYHYTGNQLNYIHDTYNHQEGFINLNTGTDDFGYDANGNLYKDKNKGINSNGDIRYNFLNLPQEIVKGVESVKYIYAANGVKLSQEVYNNNGATLVKRTDYIGEMVLEGTPGALQFIMHQEGRVLLAGSAWEYQYHMKDHLGSIRVSFTSKQHSPINHTANFENGLSGSGEGVFTNYSSNTYDLVDHTDAGTVHQRVQILNGGPSGRVGVGKSLVVMPGDEITASAYGKYRNLTGNGNPTSFATALANAFGVSAGSAGDQLRLYNGLNSFAGMVPAGDHPEDNESAPKAFVTILFFDKNYNLLDAAWDQITTAGEQFSGSVKEPPHDLLSVTAKAKEAGFAYIFVSNEHYNYVDVYFDDVTVTHTPSPIVSSSDYYPFGLSYNGYQRENTLEQQYLYGGKELQSELNLSWLDFGARMYMPESGRWGVIDPLAEKAFDWSPYRFGFNNPVRYVDPDGLMEVDANGNIHYTDPDEIANVLSGLKMVVERAKGANRYERTVVMAEDAVPQQGGLKFSTLWDDYGSDISHTDADGKDPFPNYCAINLSEALIKSGMSPGGTKCWGTCSTDKRHTIRAQELADWLQGNLSGAKVITGENFMDQIKGKTGIVFFQNYYVGEEGSMTGDHIDLWNKNEMGTYGVMRTWIRTNWPSVGEGFGMSDLSKSTQILFWEIK